MILFFFFLPRNLRPTPQLNSWIELEKPFAINKAGI